MGKEVARRGWRGAAAAAWVALAVACSAAVHWQLRRETMERAEERLVSMCEERARMLQEQFGVTVNHVHALAILISTFHFEKHPSAIDQDTFAKYTASTSFERPLLNGVAYAQRIFHHEREMFESQQGWIMKTMKREAAPPQDEYAPVIFSQDTVSYLARIDMMSGEEDRENILRARATGKAVLTNPFRLLGSNHLGVVLTFAVYRPGLAADASVEQRVEATAGYLGGAFDVESLVENLLSKLAGNQDIVVNVYDVTNASEPMVMYGPQSLDGKVPLLHVSMLDFGDPFRRHEMRCRYRQKPPMPWSAITNPLGTFVIWMLVGYIICAAWSRYDKVSEDCRKMEELKTQAEAADVAKSQFLATVSHEIRTPMNGVLGMLDMLLGTDLTLTQKDYAQTAQMCGRALITLINDVLDRAKIEAGKLELEAVPFDLRSLMDDVISLFSSKSREKCIEFAVFVCDDVPKVVIGDPWRFRQILTNLVGNAVKFTERGHVFVRVCLAENSNVEDNQVLNGTLNGKDGKVESTANGALNTLSGFQAADERNSWEYFKLLLSDKESLLDDLEGEKSNQNDSDSVTLMISIEDTGVGIPLHAQDRVFTPFMQADSSTSRNYGGTGIGLSISKCLAELMRGQISFTSRPFIGSTFTFSAVLKRSYKDTSSDSKRSLSEALPTAFKGMKAILVDGRPVRSAVTRYHLNRLGIMVQVVNNLTIGLQAFSGQNVASEPPADEGDGDDDGDMEVDGAVEREEEEVDEVAQAKAAAKALAKSSSGAVDDVADGLEELNMDDYDDEDEGLEIFSTGLGDVYYASNDMDPYLKNNDDDDDDEEIEDITIKPTDLMIVCAHNEDDINSLQVNILEETEDGDQNMFVHHEVPLSDFPLCMAWMDFNLKGGDKGNFIAVGTMDPAIEIWDLDIVDEVQPHMVLGGLAKKKKKGQGKKGKKYNKGSHRSSVLGLAWNKEVRNVLASASADKTVKIWDVAAGKCVVTLQHHDDKVQSVAWSRQSPEVLLSGSFDKSVAMNDMKDGGQSCHKWSVEADVESLAWDPHNGHSFLVSLENGMVQAFDKRTASSNSNSGRPTFTLHAHEKAVSSISFGPSTPNFLATGSTDKMVKLWDLSNNQPSCVASLSPKLGAIFSVTFSNDNPFLLACGGSKGKLKVWNTLTEPAVSSKFGK